jgi:protein ImuA
MEEGLRSTGLAGVVAETTARITLTASRRLHLAAEAAGAPGFLLRRSRSVDDPRLAEMNATVTRWRITSLPSPPPCFGRDVPGLARAVWRLDLIRCSYLRPLSRFELLRLSDTGAARTGA